MTQPTDPDPKKSSFLHKLLEDEKMRKGADFIWHRRFEFLAGALMLIGIILSFFYIHVGGALVGLAFGLSFFTEILSYFLHIQDKYPKRGLFKTLLSIGVLVYLLLSVPAFLLASAIGFGVRYFLATVYKS